MRFEALASRLPLHELRQLQAEWESNRRLRIGLLAIWGLLLLYLLLVLSDAAAAARSDLVEVDKRRDRLQAIQAQQYWLERADRSQAALRELQVTFPVVATSGRAGAQVRSLLQQTIQEAGARKLRLDVQEPRPLRDGELWQVSATVQGVVEGVIARDFLADLETRANYGRIERLKMVRGLTAEKVRVEVEMQYLFRTESG